jgi:hypothetical protein
MFQKDDFVCDYLFPNSWCGRKEKSIKAHEQAGGGEVAPQAWSDILSTAMVHVFSVDKHGHISRPRSGSVAQAVPPEA